MQLNNIKKSLNSEEKKKRTTEMINYLLLIYDPTSHHPQFHQVSAKKKRENVFQNTKKLNEKIFLQIHKCSNSMQLVLTFGFRAAN